jgi:hypothetical protein
MTLSSDELGESARPAICSAHLAEKHFRLSRSFPNTPSKRKRMNGGILQAKYMLIALIFI